MLGVRGEVRLVVRKQQEGKLLKLYKERGMTGIACGVTKGGFVPADMLDERME